MYGLKEGQKTILERVRIIAREDISPHAEVTDDEGRYPAESMEALRREGFLGLLVPDEQGGMGQDLRLMAAVLEEIARVCSSTALCYLVHLAGGETYRASHPPREELQRAVARGEHVSTLALGEFGSRSHFWSPMSRAEEQNGKIVLNATKSFVTNAGHADGYVVLTRALDSESTTDTTIYFVSAEDAGLRVSGTWDALGMRGNASAPMVFKDVTLTPDRALSPRGGGMDMLLGTILPIVNIGVAAICIGIADVATEITREHLLNSELRHMSATLADIPVERARLARMRLETDKARAHLAAVLDALESSEGDATLMVLESKVAASEAVLRVTDLAMKAVGGTAFNRKLGLERRFRDARAADVIGVTTDMLLDFIGRSLCEMPLL